MNQTLSEQLAILGGTPLRKEPWPLWPRVTPAIQEELANALHSGRWAISGAYTGQVCYERKFASEFSKFMEAEYCIPTTSGTNALLLALLALGVGPGDEVLIPGLTWVACASVVTTLGAIPILIDIDPKSLCMSLELARKAITINTKAIMIVHLYGSVGDLEGFLKLSDETNIPIIEDCAQAHGTMWNGRPVGTWGKVGCFSMQQSKLLTSGEGGAVITNDSNLAYLMEQLRSDGRIFNPQPKIGSLELIEVGDIQGHNMCLSEFQAAVLLGGLKTFAEENRIRRERAELLSKLLQNIGIEPLIFDKKITFPTFYNYVFKCNLREFSNNSIDSIARALSMELGVNFNPVYKPLNQHPLYRPLRSSRCKNELQIKKLDPRQFHLPNADSVRSTHLTFHHSLLLADEESMYDITMALEKVRYRSGDILTTTQQASNVAF